MMYRNVPGKYNRAPAGGLFMRRPVYSNRPPHNT